MEDRRSLLIGFRGRACLSHVVDEQSTEQAVIRLAAWGKEGSHLSRKDCVALRVRVACEEKWPT